MICACLQVSGYPKLVLYYNGKEQGAYRGMSHGICSSALLHTGILYAAALVGSYIPI